MIFVCCILTLCCQTVDCVIQQNDLPQRHLGNEYNNRDRISAKHNDTFIGFTAFKTSTQVVEDGDTVIFDAELLNIGGYYQPTLSHFTCPTNGIYFTSLNYKINSAGILALSIVKGEDELMTLYNGRDENPWNIASVSGVTQCQQGEVISVKCAYSFLNSAVFGEDGIPQSTFSVVLMYSGGQNLHDSFVGFTAKKLLYQDYDSLDRITFDQTLLNEGGYFNPTLNSFVCVIPGVYYASMTVVKYQDADLHIAMAKESVPVLESEESATTNWFNTVNNNRLIECSEGESMMLIGTDIGSVHGEQDIADSSFSMMLMQQHGTSQDNDSSQLHNKFIGFSAYKRTTQSYVTDETIEFDAVMLNEGDFFKPILSRFVCPFDAIYYVSVTFMKNSTEPLQLEVRKETVPFLRSIETETENPWNSVSNSGLVHCLQGHDITVKAVDSGSVYGDLYKALTTFTVMLMQAD